MARRGRWRRRQWWWRQGGGGVAASRDDEDRDDYADGGEVEQRGGDVVGSGSSDGVGGADAGWRNGWLGGCGGVRPGSCSRGLMWPTRYVFLPFSLTL